ncbi:MAG: alkaline phosphatase family protein [Candidatus Cybelea sp.]
MQRRFETRYGRTLWSAIAALIALSGCRGAGEGATFAPPSADRVRHAFLQPAYHPSGKIKHVVIIIQENRSFNNLFYGFPGAKTVSYAYNEQGKKIPLKPVTLATTWDLQHNARGFVLSCHGTGSIPGTNCKMDGFDEQWWTCGRSGPKCPNKNPPYSYVPHSETKPYFDMAHQYVLADEMFSSDFDVSSFISHQYIISGQNPDSTVNYPDGLWGCPGGKPDQIDVMGAQRKIPKGQVRPCWDPKTLADELDDAGISWAYYAAPIKDIGKACGTSPGLTGLGSKGGGSAIWSAYQAIKHVCYGPDWANNVISPPTQFLQDLKSNSLRTVSWVTPTYANSDHGGSGSKTGPSWVASLINAIGESQYWGSSAIFIFWDDSGGWYDPVPPAYVDNDGLGFRLPLLIISPYTKQGLVSHTHYEHGSILKFVEDQFGLARLAASDSRAKSPELDCFDFSQPPRAFKPIGAPYPQAYFEHQAIDFRSPDTE